MRKTLTLVWALIATVALAAAPGVAHHGWSWNAEAPIEIDGVVQEATFDGPHGVLKVVTGDTVWTVELGEPWRDEHVGLREGALTPGDAVRVIGERAADRSQRLMKADRLFVGAVEYDLHPLRD